MGGHPGRKYLLTPRMWKFGRPWHSMLELSIPMMDLLDHQAQACRRKILKRRPSMPAKVIHGKSTGLGSRQYYAKVGLSVGINEKCSRINPMLHFLRRLFNSGSSWA